jgi:hypothetical protein
VVDAEDGVAEVADAVDVAVEPQPTHRLRLLRLATVSLFSTVDISPLPSNSTISPL